MRVRALALSAAAALAACADTPLEPPLLTPLTDLPGDLAAVTFTAIGAPTVPYTMLELRSPGGFTGFVAIDASSRPVWYFRTVGSPFSFTRRAHGTFVLLDSERGLVEVTRAGEVVTELRQEQRPGRRMHHDVTVTPHNTVLFLAEEWRPWGAGLLAGEALWEWDPGSAAVAKRWSSFDVLDPDRDWGARSVAGDWLHANSVSWGRRGNVVMSLHFLNQIISIAPGFGTLEWRLGGIGATHDVDDPFSGQHTAREIARGRVLLFDNGFEREVERYSRAVEYQLQGPGAVKVWEWRPARDNWARVISSARRLPNGNTVVGFGTPRDAPPGATGPIEVYEVTRSGRVVWHLTLGGAVSSMYRATPLLSF
jgi:hypothetical protein